VSEGGLLVCVRVHDAIIAVDISSVVLGGDHPLALPLILDLESKGYIVITSVENADSISELEYRCRGYVRALVLDPSDVSPTSDWS
jgi:hypothetical protein